MFRFRVGLASSPLAAFHLVAELRPRVLNFPLCAGLRYLLMSLRTVSQLLGVCSLTSIATRDP